MPGGDICVANMGTPWPVSYGYFRATGMRIIDYAVQPGEVTSGVQEVAMQIGFWDLGEGELDGPSALWIDNVLQMAYAPGGGGRLMGSTLLGFTPSTSSSASVNIGNTPTLSAFNFHSGCDAPLTMASTSSQVGQGYDPLWEYLGDLVTPLCFSRHAYYAIAWTPAGSGGGTLSPVLDLRGMKCRLFYADGATVFPGFSAPPPYGTQTGYAFTTNPIWHFVDLWLRRSIKPEYAIDPVNGPDKLTAAEAALFNWPSILAAAQYCDQAINITAQNPAGTPRFQGSYVFAAGSTLAAMLEQVLLSCRGYWFQYAGQIYVFVDQPRPSTCLITAEALAPGSIQIDDTIVNQNANRYMGQFLETGLPAVSQIATVSVDSTGEILTVTTVNTNPCAVNDLISIGGVENPLFNLNLIVSMIPASTNSLEDNQFTCGLDPGAIAPDTTSTGGSIGYIQSRFSQRNPEINHVQHQLCQGQILPPSTTGTRLKRIKVNYDFASGTYDQSMRLLAYEVYRDLGLDQSPYLPPWKIALNLWSEWVDKSQDTTAGQTNPAAWRALKAQMVGDVITLDPSIFFEFAGDYEIMQRTLNFMQQEVEDSTGGGFIQPVTRSGAMNNGTDQNSGVLQLVLRTFNRSAVIFTDVSPAANASFATVPGQLPYAGTSPGSGSGTNVISFNFTITTPQQPTEGAQPPSYVNWPMFAIDYAGTTVTYAAGQVATGWTSSGSVPLTPESGPWTLCVNDPTLSGAGVYLAQPGVVPTGQTTPSATVVVSGDFNTPAASPSGPTTSTISS